jgi:predicted aspartyl protease
MRAGGSDAVSTRPARICSCVLGALIGLALAGSGVRAEPAPDPPAEAVLATLPFDPAARPRTIGIDLAPEGNARKLMFQLDTGADTSFVSPIMARAMGVKVSRTKSDPYRRMTRLGRDVLFYVDTRRSDTGSSSGAEFGLLGGSFLSGYVVELDFAQRRVRFLDPEQYEVPKSVSGKDEAVLPLKLVSNRPGLDVELNGRKTLLLLDTGAQPGLMLSGSHARNAKIAYEQAPACALLSVAVGRIDCHQTEIDRLEIGPFALEDRPVLVAPNGFHNLGFSGDSLIGYEVLREFLVRIDYPRERLWLQRAR